MSVVKLIRLARLGPDALMMLYSRADTPRPKEIEINRAELTLQTPAWVWLSFPAPQSTDMQLEKLLDPAAI